MQTEQKGGIRTRREAKSSSEPPLKVQSSECSRHSKQSVVKTALQSLFRKVCCLYL